MHTIPLLVCSVLITASQPLFAGGTKVKLPAPSAEYAFAKIAGQRYHPFYSYSVTPHAVVSGSRVFCAFQNSKGRPVVMAYDTAEKKWSDTVIASKHGLKDDSHGNPSLHIDTDGYLHLFYGCHNNAMRHTRSERTLDITKWQEQPTVTDKATYPQTMSLADGKVYLFYRAGAHMEPWSMRTSSDNCATFSEPRRIIEMRLAPPDKYAAAYAYFFPSSDGHIVHCFFNHKDDNAGRINRGKMEKHPWRPLKYKGLSEAVYRYNFYYIRRNPDGNWTNAAGSPVSLPVNKKEADSKCLVFDSGHEFAYPSRIADDPENRPYIKIRTAVENWGQPKKVIVPSTYRFAHFADGQWVLSDKMPAEWPRQTRAVVDAKGLAAFGDKTKGRWYIFYQNQKQGGALLFLYSERNGYANRQAGYVMCE